jgi:hypothetical protein
LFLVDVVWDEAGGFISVGGGRGRDVGVFEVEA